MNRQAMSTRDSLLALIFVLLLSVLQLPGAGKRKDQLNSVATVAFSQERGFFGAPFQVTLTTPTAGAKIYFTTNGAAPSETSGQLYEKSIAINTTTILRAMAFKDRKSVV